jgi:hypothetical protein
LPKPLIVKNATREDLYDVGRYVSQPVTAMLWARAAGRCQFAGCNRQLWKSLVTQNEINVGQKAHIRSFSPIGPRGRQGIADALLNSADNLMLVCHQCHRDIDSENGEQMFPSDVLLAMKHAQEQRIELVTGIAADQTSHILFYGSNIGEQSPVLNFHQAATAMMPGRFPASRNSISLQMQNVALSDLEEAFWKNEDANLQRLFEKRVREALNEPANVKHLSVFALAAQPLLVRLGTLLGDISEVDVYQRHREPSTWNWPEASAPLSYQVFRPQELNGVPCLIVDISGTVTRDRVHQVLGENTSIWRFTVEQPHNDIIKSPAHLTSFRTTVRKLFISIKAEHGQKTPLHVFLAAPVSVCVEFGRVRMPKADMPWVLYDHHNAHGFRPVLNID